MKASTKQILVGVTWLVILLAMIGGTMLWQHQIRKPKHTVTAVTVTSTERIPTVLLLDPKIDKEQGRQLIATMQRNNGSQAIITIKVATNGHLTINGQLQADDNRPYLKLELPSSATRDQQVQWIKKALIATRKKFKFSTYNLVSYGCGGLIAANYVENTTRKLSPSHLISIASAFNGTSTTKNTQKTSAVAANKRTATLNRLISKRAIIDPNIKVLLVAGDAKGRSNGDGVVPIQSALAAQSIYQPIVKTYQQTVIRSWRAEHIGILESWRLGNTIQAFLN